MATLTPSWRKRGYDLDLGVGIALGHATCGEVGFEGRSDYAAIGAVTNLASRLADEATAGQVLITQRLHAEVEEEVEVEPVGELTLKGFRRPIPAFNVIAVVNRRRTCPPCRAHECPSTRPRTLMCRSTPGHGICGTPDPTATWSRCGGRSDIVDVERPDTRAVLRR